MAGAEIAHTMPGQLGIPWCTTSADAFVATGIRHERRCKAAAWWLQHAPLHRAGWRQELRERGEGRRHQLVVGPLSALFALENAGVDENLEVVRDGGLTEADRLRQITDAGFGIGMRGDEGHQAQPRGLSNGLEDRGQRLRL